MPRIVPRLPRRLLPALLLAAAAQAAAAAPPAAPLADHVPADALLFFSWQGADNLQPAYAQSNLKTFLDASALPDFLATTLPQIAAKQTGNPNLGIQLQLAKNSLLPLWKHPTALYLGPLDFSHDSQNPTPRLAILCDAGPDAARLNALLTNLVQGQQAQRPFSPSLASDGSLIVLAVGFDANTLLPANPHSLAASPAYLAASAHQSAFLPPTPALSGFIDIHGILANLQEGLSKGPSVPAGAPEKINALIDLLGIRNVTQLSLSAGFDHKQWVQSTFLGVPQGPRTGLLRLADPRPLPASALRAIPQDAVTATVSTLDLDGLFNDIRDTVPKIDPTAPRQFDDALKQIRDRLGIDIHRDLIATLDGQITTYRAAADEPYVVAVKLKDPAKLAATLATLTDKANAANLPYKIEQSTRDSGDRGITYSLKLPQFALAWTIHHDSLYISTVHGLDAALDFADAQPPRPSLLDNPTFAALRKAYPDNLASISYSDPAALYPEFYQAAQLLLLMGGAELGANLPSNLLPPSETAASFFTPTIEASWSDADGIHAAARSAFPGAEVLGTQQANTSVALVAMGAAILLPSLSRARELSNRSADAANERGIAQSCVVYAADHQDHFPDDLSQLLLDSAISPKFLVSKRAGTPPMQLTDNQLEDAKTHPEQFAKDVADHTDYVYIGKGYLNDTDSSIITLYEKPNPKVIDGMNVAFEDGHVEFVRWSQLADAFQATNDYRRKHNLPLIDTTTLTPKPH